MRRWIGFALIGALAAAGCGDPTSCNGDAGELLIEVEAAALVLPDTHLEVCVNNDCNPADATSARVSVHYAGGPGGRPAIHQWHVQRRTGSDWEALARGNIDTGCSSEATAFQVEVDANAEATVTRDGVTAP